MYKSKLQVLCQKNSWDLPDYTTVKNGPDHNPRFTATVIVNGSPYETTDDSRTAKEAQNKVAKLAFYSLSPPVPALNPPPSSPSPAVTGTQSQPSSEFPEMEPDRQLSGTTPQPTMVGVPPTPQATMTETQAPPLSHETPVAVKDDLKAIDARHLYKNRLQSYAQKKNFKMPEYSCQREGPSHASRFRCSVTVNGITYEGSEYYNTVKEAEHAAAKLAWDSLAANEVQQEDCGLYKNLLQELAQKRGFRIPQYETTISGPPHMPTFLSVVEVGGQSFQGEAAKSKKQAEMIAAKVAYMGLVNGMEIKDGNNTVNNEPRATRQPEALGRSSTALQSVVTTDSNENVGANGSMVYHMEGNNNLGGNEGKVSSHPTAEKAEVGMPRPSSPLPEADENTKRHRYSPPSDNACQVSVTTTSALPPNGPIALPNEQQAGGPSSNEKIYVVPRQPNMTFPEGADFFPFSDDNWVAFKIKPTKS